MINSASGNSSFNPYQRYLESSSSDSEEIDGSEESAESSEKELSPSTKPLNRYVVDQIFQLGKMLRLRSKAANMDPLEFVIADLTGHPPKPGIASHIPEEVEHEMLSFTRLFNHGISLTQQFEEKVQLLDLTNSEQIFSISSPLELAQANLALNRMLEEIIQAEIIRNPDYAGYGNKVLSDDFREIEGISHKQILEALRKCQIINEENCLIEKANIDPQKLSTLEKAIGNLEICKKILDILFSVVFRSKREMILLRLTKTMYLDPRILSQMSQGQLTIENSNLLLACIGLKEKGKSTPVCSLQTGEYSPDLIHKIRKQNGPKIDFIDPSLTLEKQNLPSKINLEKVVQQSNVLSKGTKIFGGLVYEKLENLMRKINATFDGRVKEEIKPGLADHAILRMIIFDREQLEKFFKENSSEEYFKIIEQDFQEIRQWLLPHLDKADELAAGLLNDDLKVEDCLILEAETRLQKAAVKKAELFNLFNQFKHLIRQFLLFSTQNFSLIAPHSFTILWDMDGIKVQEKMTLEKSCAVLRRLHFPSQVVNGRTDLPYFAKEEGDSVFKRWQALCQKYNLKDNQLGDKALSLYTQGLSDPNEIPEIREFLVHLVILLMGKEPFFDRSSLVANFILLLSVKLGVKSFEEALQAMPMIPQGAVSAKHFLLHVSSHTLDAISGVQYKDKKTVLPSYFLPTIAAFLGTADSWTQKYDEVATIAVSCCRKLFMLPAFEHPRSFVKLIADVNSLLGGKFKICEIPRLIECQELKRKKAEIETICLNYLYSLGIAIKLPKDKYPLSMAVKFCKQRLINPSFRNEVAVLVAQLNQLLESENSIEDLVDMLDIDLLNELIKRKMEIANDYLVSIGELDDIETAVERCQNYLTGGLDSSNVQIQKLKAIVDRIYGASIPYSYLPEHITFDGFGDSKDELGEWAIEYIFGFHPLKK